MTLTTNKMEGCRAGLHEVDMMKEVNGGEGEIRTHGRVAPTTIFKTVAFNRSATSPI